MVKRRGAGAASGYCVWIVTPPGYIHSRCFEEVALGLHEAFAALGYDAPVVTDRRAIRGTPIVLGCNLLPQMGLTPPPDAILYNLEQIVEGSAWINSAYLDLLRRYRVWDYAQRNIEALARVGVVAVQCAIGYMPALTRIPPAAAQDVDVLFVGSVNERRQKVLTEIQRAGKIVKVGHGLYGDARDAHIAAARIVINLHFYESQVLEIVRISYLLANRICVVSETGFDPGLDAQLAGAVAFAPYDGLMNACIDLLDDDAARRQQAADGFAVFSRQSQTPMLKHALETTPDSAFARP
jgi:hypothetical protein